MFGQFIGLYKVRKRDHSIALHVMAIHTVQIAMPTMQASRIVPAGHRVVPGSSDWPAPIGWSGFSLNA